MAKFIREILSPFGKFNALPGVLYSLIAIFIFTDLSVASGGMASRTILLILLTPVIAVIHIVYIIIVPEWSKKKTACFTLTYGVVIILIGFFGNAHVSHIQLTKTQNTGDQILRKVSHYLATEDHCPKHLKDIYSIENESVPIPAINGSEFTMGALNGGCGIKFSQDSWFVCSKRINETNWYCAD